MWLVLEQQHQVSWELGCLENRIWRGSGRGNPRQLSDALKDGPYSSGRGLRIKATQAKDSQEPSLRGNDRDSEWSESRRGGGGERGLKGRAEGRCRSQRSMSLLVVGEFVLAAEGLLANWLISAVTFRSPQFSGASSLRRQLARRSSEVAKMLT